MKKSAFKTLLASSSVALGGLASLVLSHDVSSRHALPPQTPVYSLPLQNSTDIFSPSSIPTSEDKTSNEESWELALQRLQKGIRELDELRNVYALEESALQERKINIQQQIRSYLTSRYATEFDRDQEGLERITSEAYFLSSLQDGAQPSVLALEGACETAHSSYRLENLLRSQRIEKTKPDYTSESYRQRIDELTTFGNQLEVKLSSGEIDDKAFGQLLLEKDKELRKQYDTEREALSERLMKEDHIKEYRAKLSFMKKFLSGVIPEQDLSKKLEEQSRALEYLGKRFEETYGESADTISSVDVTPYLAKEAQ